MENMQSNRQQLLEHLLKHGRDQQTWSDLAKRFSIKNGDAARKIWQRYRIKCKKPLLLQKEDLIHQLDEYEQKVNLEKGESNVKVFSTKEAMTAEEIYAECKIDKSKWLLTQFWQKKRRNGFTYSADFKLKKEADLSKEAFLEYLKTFKTDHKVVVYEPKADYSKKKGCLVINKQDSHLNKYDVKGHNSIFTRFETLKAKTARMLEKANVSSQLEKVVYILGSDEFNSEFTGMTTKGTPQENAIGYHEGFNAICLHEISIINLMLNFCRNIDVVYIPGNHDEYVGWHLLNFLKCYYREQTNIIFDIAPDYTKYVRFSNTAMCFNHGDVMSPEALAKNFPIEYKKEWSSCDHFFVFTGDKHTELSRDLNGIRFYRIPALDKSSSKWDLKNGYGNSKGEMTAFLFMEKDGLSDIYKEIL